MHSQVSNRPAQGTEVESLKSGGWICPDCNCQLLLETTAWRCDSCARRFPTRNGVTHFIDTDGYWGEIPEADMRALLKEMDGAHWREALERAPNPAVGAKLPFITDMRRANWVLDTPLGRHSRVLDVGAGMGSISAALAQYVGEVVALESVALRAEFCARRFAQDGLDHIAVARADALRLPLPAASFDGIVLNGVLEWLGKGQGPGTRDVQLRALRHLRERLRPGGVLMVAIENRCAVGYFRGRVDHSYLKYTSLMPRWLADLVSQRRLRERYDTYTYHHGGYLRLFQEAGFEHVATSYPLWGYNRPDYIVPATPAVCTDMARRLAGPDRRPLRRQIRIASRRLRVTTATAEDFLFLCHTSPPGPGELRQRLESKWSDWQLPGAPPLRLVLVNRAQPGAWVYAQGVNAPVSMVKVTPRPAAGDSVAAREYQALETLGRRLAGSALGGTIPGPIALEELDGFDAAVSRFCADGLPFAAGEAPAVCARAFAWLEQFGRVLGEGTIDVDASLLTGWVPAVPELGRDLERLVLAGAERWPGRTVQNTPQHGDFGLSNLLQRPDGSLFVLDWERFQAVPLPGFDALHCAFYLSYLQSNGKPRTALRRLVDPQSRWPVRVQLGRHLEAMGYEAGDLPQLLVAYAGWYVAEYGSDPGRRPMVRQMLEILATMAETGQEHHG